MKKKFQLPNQCRGNALKKRPRDMHILMRMRHVKIMILLLFLSTTIFSQPLSPAPQGISLQANTGVSVVGNVVTPLTIASLDSWEVGTTPSPYTNAQVINPPYQNPSNPSFCNQWSSNQGGFPWNRWITLPGMACGGVPGTYGCSPFTNVTDLYFKKDIFVPANCVLQVEWAFWASDWIQYVQINGQMAYNSNVTSPPYPDHRQNGIRVSWCKWNYGAINTITVRVRTNPNNNPACRVAGLKVESWGNGTYFNIGGPTTVCAGATNVYSMPTATSLSIFSPSSYSWTLPGAPITSWTGGIFTRTTNLTASTQSGLLTGMIYNNTFNGTRCYAAGISSITVSPTISIVPSATVICAGYAAALTASGGVSYTWNAPGNPNFSNMPWVVVTPAVNTVYTLIGVTAAGCTYTRTIPVVVLPAAPVSIMASTTTVCSGRSATLTASGATGTYTWISPSGPNTNLNPKVITPTASGVYTVWGANFNGCLNYTTVTINVIPSPTVVVVPSPSVICAGSSATITASGAPVYSWAPVSSSASSIVVSPGSTTIYSATGTGTNGCTMTGTTLVSVLGLPVITVNPPFLCTGITNTLYASGALSYTWYPSSPPTGSVAGTPSFVAIPGTVAYTACGSGPTGCSACTSVTLVPGTPVPLSVTNTVICTNAAPCVNISATTTMGAVSYTWQPGAMSGSMTVACPSVNTIYTVNATSGMGCPNSATLAVTIATNCCPQTVTAGLVPLSGITGTLTNTAYILTSGINVTGLSQLQNCEIWMTPDAEIVVPPGAVLDLDHTHMFACGLNMWHGIRVQDGGRITTDYVASRIRSSMIEDAVVGIDLSNISVTNSGAGTPPIEIQRVIFNRNYIGIRITNGSTSITSLPLGITGCVFSSRNMTCTTYPTPIASNSWASAEVIPGTFWGNNPGLRVPSSPTATNELNPPYLMNNFPQINLKAPYTMQPGHIGIKIQNIGDPYAIYPSAGVDIGNTFPGYITQDFNLFDGLGIGVDVLNADVTLAANIFQNMQVYSNGTVSPIFGGTGVQAITTNDGNNKLHLIRPYGHDTGNRFWNCITGVNTESIFDMTVTEAMFRSNHSVATALMPYIPGDIGINFTSNRYKITIAKSHFNNLKNGVIFNAPAGAFFYPPTGQQYGGIYSEGLNIDNNYFGPEVASNINYSSGSANTSEYFGEAVQLNMPYIPSNYLVGYFLGSTVMSNKIDRTFRGISVNSMLVTAMWVYGNLIDIEDDYTFSSTGSPAFGYGIAAYDDASNLSVSGNTLQGRSSFAPNNVSLIYCSNTQGPLINCNKVSNSYYGFEFEGNNTGTVWEGNTMCTHFAGLALTNGGIIGQQGTMSSPSDNIWDLACANFFSFPNHTYADLSNASLSPLFVFNSGGYVPISNSSSSGTPYSIGTNVFTTGAPNATLNCTTTYPNVPNWRSSNADETVGVAENEIAGNTFKIFPNPTQDRLTIDYTEDGIDLSAIILDMTGKVVFTASGITHDNNSIDLTHLPSGMYIIELKTSNNKTARLKLVKVN